MPPLEENFSQRSAKPEMDLDLPLTRLQVEAYSFINTLSIWAVVWE